MKELWSLTPAKYWNRVVVGYGLATTLENGKDMYPPNGALCSVHEGVASVTLILILKSHFEKISVNGALAVAQNQAPTDPTAQ